MRDLNNYSGGPEGDLAEPRLQQAVNLEHPGSVIRNCVIANSPLTGVRIRQGVTVENNVIVNSVDLAIDATGGNTLSGNKNTDPAVIRNNTILGTWASGSPAGKGSAGDRDQDRQKHGDGGEHHCVHCQSRDLAGQHPSLRYDPQGNVFHRNLFANVKFYLDGKDSAVDDSDMDSLDELGFRVQDENMVADPSSCLTPHGSTVLRCTHLDRGRCSRLKIGMPPVRQLGWLHSPRVVNRSHPPTTYKRHPVC